MRKFQVHMLIIEVFYKSYLHKNRAYITEETAAKYLRKACRDNLHIFQSKFFYRSSRFFKIIIIKKTFYNSPGREIERDKESILYTIFVRQT